MFKYLTLLTAVTISLVSPASFSAEKAKIFRVRAWVEPESLDWNNSTSGVDSLFVQNIMEGLVGYSPELKPAPALASSWELSADRKTYIFHLKNGVKWEDGVPLRAQHFVDSWKRLLAPVTAAPLAYFLFDIEGAEEFNHGRLADFDQVGVKALNDSTLQVRLKQPRAYWLWIPTFWATFPIRKDLIDRYGNLWTKPGNLVTLGPFALTSRDHKQSFTLRRNPTYHGGRGNLDELKFVFIPDDFAAFRAYKNNQLDFVEGIPISQQIKLKGKKDFYTYPILGVVYLRFNQSRYPMTSPRFRRAISLALDRSELRKVISNDLQLTGTFAPGSMLASPKKAEANFNVSLARRELAASGVDSSKMSIGLTVINSGSFPAAARMIQAQLRKNLNLKVDLRFVENIPMNVPDALMLDSWGADYPDLDSFYAAFLSSANTDHIAWKSEAYDRLVLQGGTAVDPAARQRIYQEADDLLVNKEVIIIPLYNATSATLIRSGVRGFNLNTLTAYLFKNISM